MQHFVVEDFTVFDGSLQRFLQKLIIAISLYVFGSCLPAFDGFLIVFYSINQSSSKLTAINKSTKFLFLVEKVLQHSMAVLGQNALGVKLHALDGQFAMAHPWISPSSLVKTVFPGTQAACCGL